MKRTKLPITDTSGPMPGEVAKWRKPLANIERGFPALESRSGRPASACFIVTVHCYDPSTVLIACRRRAAAVRCSDRCHAQMHPWALHPI